MTRNKFTNLLIVALAFLAVVQTGGLWLSQTKSHNLFYSAINSILTASSNTTEYYRTIEAEKTAIGTGNNNYVLLYEKNDKKADSAIKSAIGTAIEKGAVNSSGTIDWNILSGKNIVMEYPFSVSFAEFSKGFPSASLNSSIPDNFNCIVITPSFSDSGTYVTFISTGEQKFVSLVIEDSETTTALRSVIDSTSADGLAYISSAQSGFNIFKNNVFLPQWTEGEYLYPSVYPVSMGTDKNGTFSSSEIKQMVHPLFLPSGFDRSGIDESGIHYFNSDEIVVKYYPNGILEYFNYKKSNESQTLASAYDACMKFIEKDVSIKTDIFLTDADVTTEGLVFKFDYSVKNIPVELSASLKEDLGIESAIEVVVTNNTVKKYRKYSCNFYESSENDMSANVDFLTEINRVITEQSTDGEIMQVDDISLCYYTDGNNVCPLKWITDIGGSSYIGDTLTFADEGE
ncbi:MAG: hypothetical protein IJF29_04670 [Firmicutes bacterium]|nr:hypothetical protein [Bacillota bacterium]